MPTTSRILLDEVKSHILANLDQNLSINYLCRQFHMGKTKMQHLFNMHTQRSLHAFILQQRMSKAKMLLVKTDEPIKVIASVCGYKNVRSFYKSFKSITGFSPIEFRSNREENKVGESSEHSAESRPI